MTRLFDGHANCFIESGHGKALLIDFNYDTEPLPASTRWPVSARSACSTRAGPTTSGKLGFRWMYWNVLLPRPPHPDPGQMSMSGKHPSWEGVSRRCPSHTIDGHLVQVDDEGFLTEYDEWDEDLAKVLAAHIDIDLTDAHWKAIRFLRADYKATGETATTRRVQTAGGIPVKEQFALFPKKPAKKMAYVAGLPKPHGCV